MGVENNGIKLHFEDDHWTLVNTQFEKTSNRTWETLFSLGNGYIGMRGTFEEGLDQFSTEGTFINGFYDSFPLHYPEKFIGYAETDQIMLNVANARLIRLMFEDGETYNPLARKSRILAYTRRLKMRSGLLIREFTWQSPTGRVIRIKSERIVSFRRPHVAAVRLTITPENDCGSELTITSLIDSRAQRSREGQPDPRSAAGLENIETRIEGQQIAAHGAFLYQRTINTQIAVACGLRDNLPGYDFPDITPFNQDGAIIGNSYTIPLDDGQPVVFEKYIAYCTSLDTRPDDLYDTVRDELDQASALGFEALCAEQRTYLDDFWQHADITVDGDPRLQGAIRFNLYHLLQSAGQNGQTSIPAKGLSGQGYNGHYFWDTEAYMLPFFLHTMPGIARKLLEYRYHTLKRARRRAREMSHPSGALYPWRTINGAECSANPPTGTAQVHINADIAFAVKRYYEITGDADFMRRCGAEILFETARLWANLGAYIPTRGNRFCIHGVTGPDEYTTLVDNNTYTNLMARENLWSAAKIAAWLEESYPADYDQLAKRIGLDDAESDEWQRAADAMFVPEPVNVGPPDMPRLITPQDDSFLYKPVWPIDREQTTPLLLKHHPLVYNRYQVCKQADLILAEFMLGHLFTPEQKRRDFDYYEQVTTHDSSLSRCIFSIMAAEIADPADPDDPYLALAADFYHDSATIDLDNHRNETQRGIHAANMGGSWMGIIFGFAGMRTPPDCLAFAPVLPPEWSAYTFRVYYQGRRVQVATGPGRDTDGRPLVTLTLLEGDDLDVCLYGETVHLSAFAVSPSP